MNKKITLILSSVLVLSALAGCDAGGKKLDAFTLKAEDISAIKVSKKYEITEDAMTFLAKAVDGSIKTARGYEYFSTERELEGIGIYESKYESSLFIGQGTYESSRKRSYKIGTFESVDFEANYSQVILEDKLYGIDTEFYEGVEAFPGYYIENVNVEEVQADNEARLKEELIESRDVVITPMMGLEYAVIAPDQVDFVFGETDSKHAIFAYSMDAVVEDGTYLFNENLYVRHNKVVGYGAIVFEKVKGNWRITSSCLDYNGYSDYKEQGSSYVPLGELKYNGGMAMGVRYTFSDLKINAKRFAKQFPKAYVAALDFTGKYITEARNEQGEITGISVNDGSSLVFDNRTGSANITLSLGGKDGLRITGAVIYEVMNEETGLYEDNILETDVVLENLPYNDAELEVRTYQENPPYYVIPDGYTDMFASSFSLFGDLSWEIEKTEDAYSAKVYLKNVYPGISMGM